MLLLSSSFASLIEIFAPLFDSRVWSYAELLLVGAALAPGKRTVSSVLRIVGLGSEKHFQNYHRVLNRTRWSGRAASQILLGLLLRAFSPCGPILVGLDDTIERRWGKQIQARGIYRDPVRSSHSHFVKTSGLRWLSLMLLVDIPWAGRVWALPFLTVTSRSCCSRSVSRSSFMARGVVDLSRSLSRSREAETRGALLCSPLPVPELRRRQVAARGRS